MQLVAMPQEDLVSMVCVGVGKEANCSLDEEQDGPKVKAFIDSYMKTCATKKLKEKNMCTDKLDAYLSVN